MRVNAVQLRQLDIPMVEPLAAAHGTVNLRSSVILEVFTDDGIGWGECVALNEPTYIAEWSSGEYYVLSEILIPALFRAGDIAAEDLQKVLAPFQGHNPAKAALETALLDVQLKAQQQSLADYLGTTVSKVECCAVIGLLSGDAFMSSVEDKLRRGYKSVKLKVMPGNDVERIDRVKKAFPELHLNVDANGSYDWENPEHRNALMEIDGRGVSVIEQPLPPERAAWYTALRRSMSTPIGLDESIVSFNRGVNAIEFGLCDVVGIKPGLLGGPLTAKRLHDVCLGAEMSTSLGGMIETGIARSVNLALAGLDGFRSHPSEIAPDGRWFTETLNSNAVKMVDGCIDVPTTPGIGVEVDTDLLARLTRRTSIMRRND